MAVVSSQGLSGTMPPHCGSLALIFFFVTLVLNIGRDVAPPKYRRFMPVPMAIGELDGGIEVRGEKHGEALAMLRRCRFLVSLGLRV